MFGLPPHDLAFELPVEDAPPDETFDDLSLDNISAEMSVPPLLSFPLHVRRDAFQIEDMNRLLFAAECLRTRRAEDSATANARLARAREIGGVLLDWVSVADADTRARVLEALRAPAAAPCVPDLVASMMLAGLARRRLGFNDSPAPEGVRHWLRELRPSAESFKHSLDFLESRDAAGRLRHSTSSATALSPLRMDRSRLPFLCRLILEEVSPS